MARMTSTTSASSFTRSDVALYGLEPYFDTWCGTEDLPTLTGRIQHCKQVHDALLTAANNKGCDLVPRDVPFSFVARSPMSSSAMPADLFGVDDDITKEVTNTARQVSLAVLRNVALMSLAPPSHCGSTSNASFPLPTEGSAASSDTFGDAADDASPPQPAPSSSPLTASSTPPPPSLDRTTGPIPEEPATPPVAATFTQRRQRNLSVIAANGGLTSQKFDGDRSRREMARALADMTALYLNAVQREWTLERQLMLVESELNDMKEIVAMGSAKASAKGQHHGPPPKLPVAPQAVAIAALRARMTLHSPTPGLGAAAVAELPTSATTLGAGLRSPRHGSPRHSPAASPTPHDLSPQQSSGNQQVSGLTVATPGNPPSPMSHHLLRSSASSGRFGGTYNDLTSFASVGAFSGPKVHATAKAVVGNDAEADGSTTLNQYILLAELGAGSQGKVLLAVDTETGEARAVKQIPRPTIGPGIRSRVDNARILTQLQREIAIMKRCRHRNVVALYEVIDDPEALHLYLVMQYIEHGPLARLHVDGTTTPLDPTRLASFARQLTAGLHYLHDRKVVHRDIKPENILLGSNDTVFLADFGISTVEQPDDAAEPLTLVTGPSVAADFANSLSEAFDAPNAAHKQPQHGTLVFRAPELLSGDRVEATGGGALPYAPADVWALGLSIYIMLYGRLPWPLQGANQFMQAILTSPIDFPEIAPNTAYIPAPWLDLLRGMLDKSPKSRFTARQAHSKAKELQLAMEDSASSLMGSVKLSDDEVRQAFTTVRRGGGGGGGGGGHGLTPSHSM